MQRMKTRHNGEEKRAPQGRHMRAAPGGAWFDNG